MNVVKFYYKNLINIRYGYSPPMYLVQEIDGLRIITLEKNEFLQVVPKSLKDVFGIAAFEASSTLYEASIAFYDVI
jgi:vacuolar protein sorting-associated protein 16